jgi:transcriptional regulator with XRE-family HTH domain
MTFFERYSDLCLSHGYKPVSEQAAQAIGSSRGTISTWKIGNNLPRPEVIVTIANAYHVSTDYLLGRTDDPVDYSDPEELVRIAKEATGNDALRAAATRRLVDLDAKEKAARQAATVLLSLYDRLDAADKGKLEGFAQGLLLQGKYNNG